MRAGCVIALIGGLASLAAAAEQEFPYVAYVAGREAAVRSGPARNFYATDRLLLGDTVEVYRHEDDWCAIRPPPDSFSWVKADDLRIGRDGIGIVLAEGAASRVGSRTSELRDVIQVRLERGEEVEVLDAVQVSNDNGVEFYCKIAPPSGEFRWIHRDDISREKPAADHADAGDRDRQRQSPDAREQSDDDARGERSDRWGSWVRSRRIDSMGDPDPNSADRHSASLDSQQSGRGRTIALASADEDGHVGVRKERASNSSARDASALTAEVESIDRELSRIVVLDPAEWSFDAVRRRADAAMAKASSSQARDMVRELQDKIARFDDIHRRSLAIASPVASAPSALAAASAATTANANEIKLPPPSNTAVGPASDPQVAGRDTGRYDGVGKLTRVVSKRPNAPRYALVNNANEVVSFVSPAAGVNLALYEGQRVGISGQRGYMPELKKPHVTAMRINPLDGGQARVARRR